MSIEQFGYIYRNCDTVVAKTQPLSYMGQPLEFFVPTLCHSMAITATDETLGNFDMTFFVGSEFAQTLSFRAVEVEQTATVKACSHLYKNLAENHGDQLLARVALVHENLEHQTTADLLAKPSAFIRGSTSLLAETLEPMSGRDKWHIDGRGVVFISPYQGMQQPRRVILLVMLALAYQLALNQISEALANIVKLPESAENIQALNELYLKSAKFNAQFYFSAPVQVNRYATYQAWEKINQVYKLEREYQETNSQLDQVHRILTFHHQQCEQQLMAKRNKIIAMFGVLITVLNLLQPLDIMLNWNKNGNWQKISHYLGQLFGF
ncbi:MULTISPECIES: hypothetical protein [unclassified Moraxella]|uniref:hypothetical protein n=1 Tax=unclassified Moraxella TaxID=2685852 RepID=UPI003AF68556